MKPISLLLLALFFARPLLAQPAAITVPSADEVMKDACKEAARDHKNVFIMFHASWCGWCHRMDSSMLDPVCRKFFDDNYVIRHLVVDETNYKNYENPGANEMRTKYKGDGQGIPFWLIFDKDGKLLADSKLRTDANDGGTNIGCPARQDEVNAFIDILKKTSKLEKSDLDIIQKRFLKNQE